MSNVRACRAASTGLVRPRLVTTWRQPDVSSQRATELEEGVHGRYLDRRRFGVLEQLEHGVVRRRTGVLHGLE
jgi:hypothetical protein